MKNIIALFALLGCFVLPLSAQELKGIATYQTKTTMDMSRFPSDMSEQMKKQMTERMKGMLEKTFTLTFTKAESIYEEVEKLDAPTASGGGGSRFMGGSFAQGGIYKNTAEDTYARENDLMGKSFLVKDSLQKLEWKLENESKMIGQYAAFKATAVRKIDGNPWEAMRRRGDKKEEDSTAAGMPTEVVITAWYTPQIPISQGPDEYWGLPGLILEVAAGRTVIICNKIVINPKDELVIERPKKGQEVTRKEYQDILIEKTKEMRERSGSFGPPGGRRRG